MSNLTSISSMDGELFCPLLDTMRRHSLNNNTQVNMVVVCFHGLVSCLGILENALILWVVGFRLRHRTVASIWVLNLAMSDFLATLTLPLFTHYFHSSQSWELGGTLCKVQASVFYLNMFVSAFLLAAISLDRCLLVVRPVWSQNHRTVAGAWKVCALGWLWATINTFPYFLFREVTEKLNGKKLCYHNFALHTSPEAKLKNCYIRETATAISKILLAFLLPLVVIAVSYFLFAISLRKRALKRRQSIGRLTGALITTNIDRASITTNTTKSTNVFLKPPGVTPTQSSPTSLLPPSPSSQANQSLLSQSFTKMVTCVIAAFALCWAPYHIFCLIEVAAQYHDRSQTSVEIGMPIAATLAFLNPVLNPVLYAFSCPNFSVRIRQSLGALFEGLVEEGGGITFVPGRSRRACSGRCSSLDASSTSNTSPNCPRSPSQLPHATLHPIHLQGLKASDKEQEGRDWKNDGQ